MLTISDVARQAGVSPATVSRVIQGARNVSPGTRERVERAIQELGYVPSAVARSLRSKRTRSLALLVSDINNAFWTTIARGVEDVAQRHDYSVLLCNTDENLAKQFRYLDVLISQQVDGVIIAPFDTDARHLDKLRRRSIPTVVVDRRIEGWEVDCVYSDSVSGARALVQHLLRLGHTRIAMISGPGKTSTAEDRVAGYSMALIEAGIPLDHRLIRRGEYRLASGEELTHQLFDEGFNPTAIFAANNVLALGAIDALEKRGLRVPLDVALVCFDDLPNVSHLFPFLTVVVQPVYDMGVNAAQLLFSRLDSEVELRPREVILPVRLIVRHSCGSQLKAGSHYPLSLPISRDGLAPSVMVKPLSPEERQRIPTSSAQTSKAEPAGPGWPSDGDKPDVNRLIKALRHEEADRLPHLECEVASKAVYEYVLERELQVDMVAAKLAGLAIAPEDQVDFALRLGLDAVSCPFSWRPRSVDPVDLDPSPSFADQLSFLERYLRAARGTGVGVMASFSSFFDAAWQAINSAGGLHDVREGLALLGKWMDILLENQERIMRAVCDRFANDLALIIIHDNIGHSRVLKIDPEAFLEIFLPRMKRLISPAQEHGKLLMMHTQGATDQILAIVRDVGFDAAYIVGAGLDEVAEIKRTWGHRLTLVGGFPTQLLVHGSPGEIEARVRQYCATLAAGGGYVFGSSDGITEDVPPPNLVAMSRAITRYGRHGSLGRQQ